MDIIQNLATTTMDIPMKKRPAACLTLSPTHQHDVGLVSQMSKRPRRLVCRHACQCPTQITIISKHKKVVKTCPSVLDVVPYFSALASFRNQECSDSESIELSEFEEHTIAMALSYLQNGQCEVDESNLSETLHIADFLRLDSLISHCIITLHACVMLGTLPMELAHQLLSRHSLGIPTLLFYSVCDLAIQLGYAPIILDGLEKGMCPNGRYETLCSKPLGLNLFLKAIYYGHIDIVRVLLQFGANLDSQSDRTGKPTCFDEKDTPWVENYHTLKQKYAPRTNQKNNVTTAGATALHLAVWRNDLEMIKLLVQSGSKIRPDQDGETLVHVAAALGHINILKFFVRQVYHGLFDAHTNIMGTPLFRAVLTCGSETLQYMIECGADPWQTDYAGFTVLSYAAVSNNLAAVRFLHEQLGMSLMELNDNRETALHQCASLGHLEVIEYCVKKDKQLLDVQDERGDTLLHVAVLYDQMEAARILITAESQVNLANYLNEHPLHIALMENCTEIIPRLLAAGANPNAILTIRDTATPLTLAIMCGGESTLDYVKLLLQHGADPSLLHNKALILALRENIHQKDDIVKLLLEHGASANARCMGTPLLMDLCAMPNSSHLATLLIKHGADVNAINRQGQTSLMVACAKENNQVVEILLKHGAKAHLRTWHGLSARMILNTSQNSSQSLLKLLDDYEQPLSGLLSNS